MPVLEDINLTVQPTDFIGLIGPNGGGKTTLLKVILGLIKPTHGQVRIMGQSVRGWPLHGWLCAPGCGNGPPVPDPRVGSGADGAARLPKTIPAHHRRRNERSSAARSNRWKCWIWKTAPSVTYPSASASASISPARSTTSPAILLLDEPTASVDPQVANSIYEMLSRLNQTVTIIMVSHDMNAVSAYVKTIGCLNKNLHYHGSKEITAEMADAMYECPVDLIAHGLPHRVLSPHTHVHTHMEVSA